MGKHYEYEYYTFEIDEIGNAIDDSREEHYGSLDAAHKRYVYPTYDDGVRCVVRVRRKEVYDDGYFDDWEEADFVGNPFEPRDGGWIDFDVPKSIVRRIRGFFNNCMKGGR